MDKPLLRSVSEDTLVTAISTLGVKSATNITSGPGTPYPKNNLSDETLQLFEQAADSLKAKPSTTSQPTKRKRLQSSEDKKRTNYTQASKSIYLKTKTLHRRKLSFATNIHQIKKLLVENKFPLQADFNSKTIGWLLLTDVSKN